MKTVELMRHGAYDQITGDLTPEGVAQVTRTAQKMLDAGDAATVIHYADVPRIAQTARIVAGVFNAAGRPVTLVPLTELGAREEDQAPTVARHRALDNTIEKVLDITHDNIMRGLSIAFGSRLPRPTVEHAEAYVLEPEADTGDWNTLGRMRIRRRYTP